MNRLNYKNIIVCGEKIAEELINKEYVHNKNTFSHLISIRSEYSDRQPFYNLFKGTKIEILCDDSCDIDGPSSENINQLINFYEKIPNNFDKKIIIHCSHGISRSTATLIILLYLDTQNIDLSLELFDKIIILNESFGFRKSTLAKPNPQFIDLADAKLNCNQNLFNKVFEKYKHLLKYKNYKSLKQLKDFSEQ